MLCAQLHEVNRAFETFCQQLYISEFQANHNEYEGHRQTTTPKKHFPKKWSAWLFGLCFALLEELKLALDSMKSNKAQGLDRVPPELLCVLWEFVDSHVLNSFNFAFEDSALHKDQNTTLITLLLKKRRDPSYSYRPVSLISTDSKLFASWLDQCIGDLINYDQPGVLKARYASDNMRCLLHIIDWTSSYASSAADLSLDTEKAFRRIKWNLLWSVLEHWFGIQFISP